MENMKKAFSDYLLIIKKLVGYKKCEAIKKAEEKIIILLSTINNLNSKLTEDLITLHKELVEITNYQDYNMFIKTSDIKNVEISSLYLNLLRNNDGKIYYLNEIELKTILNEECLKGDIDLIRLKAILMYLGEIYEKNESTSIEILKFLAYHGDLISLKILSSIVSDNEKQYYKELYLCLEEIYNSYIFDLNDLKYEKKIIDACKMCLENKKNEEKSLAYIFLNNKDEIYKTKNITEKTLFKRSKLGF